MASLADFPQLIDAPDEPALTIVVRPALQGGDAAIGILVQRRPGGAMLALPRAALSADILAETFGPYTDLTLPAADPESPELADPSLELDITAVDVSDESLELILDLQAQPSIGFATDPGTS